MPRQKGRRAFRPFGRGLAALLLLVVAAACAPTVEYGAKPRTDALDRLTIAASTPSDIRAALGEPRGHGVARFAEDPTPRGLWFYDYVKTDGQAIDLKILLVLLKEDRYDGHFWFSSVELVEPLE